MRLASSEGCKGKDCSECFTLYKWGFNACVISCSKTNEAPEKQTMLMRMPKGRDNHRCNFLNNFFIVELKLVVRSIVSLPIILIVAVPLLIESRGPLIFKQQRVGKNGRVFNIYKLRSMYVDAEERKKELMAQNKMDGLMFKMDNDPAV